jgi:hypothetical protein
MFAVIEAHMAFTTIKAGKTGITPRAKLFTDGVRGKDSRR